MATRQRYAEQIALYERALALDPVSEKAQGFLALASTYALKGETVRAADELAQARKLSGDDRYSSIARLRAAGPFGAPKIRALFEATYLVGLRKAGMREV